MLDYKKQEKAAKAIFPKMSKKAYAYFVLHLLTQMMPERKDEFTRERYLDCLTFFSYSFSKNAPHPTDWDGEAIIKRFNKEVGLTKELRELTQNMDAVYKEMKLPENTSVLFVFMYAFIQTYYEAKNAGLETRAVLEKYARLLAIA